MKHLALTALLLTTSLSFAQTAPAAPAAAPAPATALDAFLNQTGVLTIRESLGSRIVPVLYGGSLNLEAVKLYLPGKENAALLGIRIGVNDGEKYSSTRYEFIELAEVEGMIKALDYMVAAVPKLDTTVKPEMRFASKSEATVGLFYSSYDKKFSGFAKASTETVYMELSSLTALRQALSDLLPVLK